MRALLIAVLLLSFLGQSLTRAGDGLASIGPDGLPHASLHWDKQAHHHHDDGSFHEEDSDESARHLQADGILSVVALASSMPVSLPPAVLPVAEAMGLSAIPSPVRDGLRRPPRLPA